MLCVKKPGPGCVWLLCRLTKSANPGGALIPRVRLSSELLPVGCGGAVTRVALV
jgi:hypothetical protein